MLYMKKFEGAVEAEEFVLGMEDGVEKQCSRNERCEYEDDGYCFDSPAQCDYQRLIPYINIETAGTTKQGYPNVGDYIIIVDEYRKKIVPRKEFISQYSLYTP